MKQVGIFKLLRSFIMLEIAYPSDESILRIFGGLGSQNNNLHLFQMNLKLETVEENLPT